MYIDQLKHAIKIDVENAVAPLEIALKDAKVAADKAVVEVERQRNTTTSYLDVMSTRLTCHLAVAERS